MATLHNSPAGDVAKVEELLLYIFQKAADKPNVGETVLHKLLYFIDFDHYEIHEEPLMGCRYVRNHYGPTVVGLDQWLADMVIRGILSRLSASSMNTGKEATSRCATLI